MTPTIEKSGGNVDIIFLCHTLTGHFNPVLRIATALHTRGWSVSFLGSTFFRSRIEAAGLEFFQLEGQADLDDRKLFDGALKSDGSVPVVRSVFDSRHQTLEAIPAQWDSFKAALATLKTRSPNRQVIVVCEAFFYGALPLKLGAALPEGCPPPRTICVSITAPAIRSVDLPPFGFPLPFDPSDAGRGNNAQAWKEWEEQARSVTQLLDQKLVEAGCNRGLQGVFMSGGNYTLHDVVLQIGLPGFEYPRSDFPENFKIVGILPPVQVMGRADLDWWGDLVANSAFDPSDPRRKKVVVVAQGTVETEPTELIIPTMQYLSNREDVLTIAILGARGARLSDKYEISSNTKVVDYLHYDAVLPFADIWVHNGGYGATTHGLAHGTPMVVAGDGQDKPESVKRIAWSGVGIDLECASPGIEKLGKAIETVMADSKFKVVANRMKQTADAMNCINAVEEEIRRFSQ